MESIVETREWAKSACRAVKKYADHRGAVIWVGGVPKMHFDNFSERIQHELGYRYPPLIFDPESMANFGNTFVKCLEDGYDTRQADEVVGEEEECIIFYVEQGTNFDRAWLTSLRAGAIWHDQDTFEFTPPRVIVLSEDPADSMRNLAKGDTPIGYDMRVKWFTYQFVGADTELERGAIEVEAKRAKICPGPKIDTEGVF